MLAGATGLNPGTRASWSRCHCCHHHPAAASSQTRPGLLWIPGLWPPRAARVLYWGQCHLLSPSAASAAGCRCPGRDAFLFLYTLSAGQMPLKSAFHLSVPCGAELRGSEGVRGDLPVGCPAPGLCRGGHPSLGEAGPALTQPGSSVVDLTKRELLSVGRSAAEVSNSCATSC